MGRTYKRGQPFKTKGKDFNDFKKSNKFKKWKEKPHHNHIPTEEKDVVIEETDAQ
jgi:hypothetical protein